MRIFLVYLKQYRLGIGLFFMFCAVFAAAFYLYSLPLGAVLYPAAICLAVGVTALLIKARILRKKAPCAFRNDAAPRRADGRFSRSRHRG